MALVNRDPFARHELHRESIDVGLASSGCAWCGSKRVTRGGNYRLYRYRTETDGGRTSTEDRLFCSAGCRRAFWGE